MRKIHIDASKEYDVMIAEDIMDASGEIIAGILPKSKAALISDDKVFSIYGKRVINSLENAGFDVVCHIFPNGETSKNMTEYVKILEFLAENTLTRSDFVVALGGGVTGDMAGFAAATYLRGIKFVQIPTTFLAAVDSSVGGKTGVNLKNGKNLAGAFHQPSAVICDTKTLDTLDDDTFADGVSESIKCAMIANQELFAKMKGDFKSCIDDIIFECVSIKRKVVCEDEFDTGARQLLNFGHTVGHAIEKCSDFTVTHGHAVAIGMAVITKAAEKNGICENGTYEELIAVLNKCGLPSKCCYSPEKLYEVMLSDKKRTGGDITLVLPKKVGECVLSKMKTENLLEFVRKGME